MAKIFRGIVVLGLLLLLAGCFYVLHILSFQMGQASIMVPGNPTGILKDGIYEKGQYVGSREWVEENARRGMYSKEEADLARLFYWNHLGMAVPFVKYDDFPIIVLDKWESGDRPWSEFEVIGVLQADTSLYYSWEWEKQLEADSAPLDVIKIKSGQAEKLCQRCGESLFVQPEKIRTETHYEASVIKNFQAKRFSDLAELPDGEYTILHLYMDRNTSAVYLINLSDKLQELQRWRTSKRAIYQKMAWMMIRDLEGFFRLKDGETFLLKSNTYRVDSADSMPWFMKVPVKIDHFHADRRF